MFLRRLLFSSRAHSTSTVDSFRMDVLPRSRIVLPSIGLQVVLQDPRKRNDCSIIYRWSFRPPINFSGVIDALIKYGKMSLADYFSLRKAYTDEEDQSSLFRGPIASPCNILLCPIGSSLVKFISEHDGFETVKFVDFGVRQATLAGMDGNFFLMLVHTNSHTCFNVYDVKKDATETVLAPLASKASVLDIRVGFLVHNEDYFIVCIYVLRSKSRAFFYASAESDEGWKEVENVAIPRHLSDYVATRSKYELFWVNFDKDMASMTVLVFDVFTQFFNEVTIVNRSFESCESASVVSTMPYNLDSNIIDIWLVLVMKNADIEFLAYEMQGDEAYAFVAKFVVSGPTPSPERILFSLGAGVFVATNSASVWRLDLLKCRVKRRSVVPQHLEDASPIVHSLFAREPNDLLLTLKKWKMRLLGSLEGTRMDLACV